MTTPRDRRSPGLLLRTVVLVVALTAAPVALGADGADTAGGRTSADVAAEVAKAKADQAALARDVEARRREAAQLASMQVDLAGDIDETTAALGEINADLTAVRQQVVDMVDRIEQVKAHYAHLVAELEALDLQLADLVAREEAKRAQVRDRQALLADRLRLANEADQTTFLEVLLSAGSFSDVLEEVSYHLHAGAQDRALAERVELDRQTLAILRATIETTRADTNVVRQATAVQKKKLDAELVVLEDTKARLAELEALTARELAAETAAFEELSRTRTDVEADIAHGQAAQEALANQIAALVEEEARLAAEEARRRAEEARRRAEARRAAEAARLAEEAARLGSIPSVYNGTFRWPLVGRVTGEWGCSRYPGYPPGGPGCDHFHNGIDIARGCGSRVVAAGDGRVAYVGWNWADGPDPAWMVVIAHSGSLNTWYAHMSPRAPRGIRFGARVKAGQVIGYEGNTGRSTGCHLHWMVERNGEFLNGRLFL